MGRPRFAFFSTLAFCLTLAHAAVAGINFVGTELVNVAPRPEYMAAGDFNNDHLTDIVVIAPQSNEVDVYLAADTPSHFDPARTIHFGAKLGRPALGDLNGDGLLDLVVTDISAKSVWILIGKGDGTFLTPYQIAVPSSKHPSSVAIANFDTLGYNDLAVADSVEGRVFILRNDNGTPPRFLQGGQIDVGLDPEDIRAVDLNGDGNPDLLVLNLGGPRVKELDTILWTGVTQGFPAFDPPQRFTIGSNPSSMVVADFDNNGLPDVAMLNRPAGSTGNSEIDVLLNTGNGVFSPPAVVPVPCPFETFGSPCKSLVLAAGDFDDNGDVDLMVALSDPLHSSLADAMQAFGGRGDGGFVPGGVFAIQKTPLSMVAANITGPAGKLDLAIANQQTLNLQAFVNVSTTGSTPDGDMCLLDDECLANRCTDGVCCASQCDVTNNEKCNVPRREGTCVAIPTAPTTCKLPTPPNPACPTLQFCVDGFCCDQSCQGGHCDLDGFQGVCIPGLPNGQPCTGDNNECSSGFCSGNLVCCNSACTDGVCDQFGICHALSPNGADCQMNSDCQSDICDQFDGICCQTQCDSVTEKCFPVQGICRPLTYTPGPGTPGYQTPAPTPTATPRLTPAPIGELCSIPTDCQNGNCVDGVCCQTSSCGDGQQCQQHTGMCAGVTPTPTATVQPTETTAPTPLPTLPTPDPCGAPSTCPNGEKCQVINGLPACVKASTSGGCSTAGEEPARGNLAIAALLPLALWAGRRWQLRRVRVRSRALRQ